MKSKFGISILLVLITSILPDLIFQLVMTSAPKWLIFAKVGILALIFIFLMLHNALSELTKLCGLLIAVLLTQICTNAIQASPLWMAAFNTQTFIGQIGSNILLKFLGIIPVIAVMLFVFKASEDFYLNRGDLSIKADKIAWLGIGQGKISWGKLSVISAVLISLGTILLTMGTATGFAIPKGIEKLAGYLPVIILFALCNSFCEGIIYRNTILGAVNGIFSKNQAILLAALFFGIAHYSGIPGGPIGAVMSGLLGWYMCRSMVETKGFVSAWIIHFMQDAVIFSTVCVLSYL